MKIHKSRHKTFRRCQKTSTYQAYKVIKKLYKYVRLATLYPIYTSIQKRRQRFDEITRTTLADINIKYMKGIMDFDEPYFARTLEAGHSDDSDDSETERKVIKRSKKITPGFTTKALAELIENKASRTMVQQSLRYFIMEPEGILSRYKRTTIRDNLEAKFMLRGMYKVFGIGLETYGCNVMTNLEILILDKQYEGNVTTDVISTIYDYGITKDENMSIKHLPTGTHIKFDGIDIFESSKFEEVLDNVMVLLNDAIADSNFGEMYDAYLYDATKMIEDIQRILINTAIETYKEKYNKNKCLVLFSPCKLHERFICKVQYDLYKLPDAAINALVRCLKDKRRQELTEVISLYENNKTLIDSLR